MVLTALQNSISAALRDHYAMCENPTSSMGQLPQRLLHHASGLDLYISLRGDFIKKRPLPFRCDVHLAHLQMPLLRCQEVLPCDDAVDLVIFAQHWQVSKAHAAEQCIA